MPDSKDPSPLKTRYTLLDRIKDPNDEKSWKEFISYYEQYIYNILRTIGIQESDARELCQDIIVKLWKKLPELAYTRDKGKFRSWLGVVIRNDAYKYFNKKNREEKIICTNTNEDTLSNEPNAESSDDIDRIIVDEWDSYISNLAWESIKNRFNKSMQEVFLLHADGKSNKEIADILGLQESSVRSSTMRIRNHLKDEINSFNRELL